MTEDEIKEYNAEYSPRILLRMGWDYYNTETAARIVAEQADKEIAALEARIKELENKGNATAAVPD